MRTKTFAGLRVFPLIAGLFLTGIVAPAAAQAPALAMLGGLDHGEWELRFRDGAAPRRICVRNGQEFIQIKHTETGCNRFVVDDGPRVVTVQYTCRGNGYGRTTVRQESRALVQISSQGIAGGTPFDLTGEARRLGPCR